MIETCDLYKGAYLMCCGGHLKEMKKTRNHQGGPPHVVFVIKGDLMKEDLLYKTGRAEVNPLDLRKFINFLRDQINERKNYETRTRNKKK